MMQMMIQDKDKEIQSIFERHLSFVQENSGKYSRYQNKEHSSLLPDLIEKTEEMFQFFLANNFSNEQQNVIAQKRQEMDDAYIDLFKDIVNGNKANKQ